MPAWWGRRADKAAHTTTKDVQAHISKSNPKSHQNSPRSPRASDDPGSGSGSGPGPRRNGSGSSGFDSDGCGGEKRVVGHPLPRPSSSHCGVGGAGDHGGGGGGGGGAGGGVVMGFGSGSVSSVSSSGSASDELPPLLDHLTLSRTRNPASPLHQRVGGINLESLNGRHDDGRSQGHPLPLPPSSPTSPSLANVRTGFHVDNTHNSLSKWKKGKLLGRGTFGHVYLGFNSEGGHMCAIKEVRIVSDDHNSRESLKQLNQEINLLNHLSHPNIVRYYGSELGDDTLSVYLEYVSGGSIHKLLQEYGAFKEPVIQNYTRQILSGLAYLHSRNTLHRDIKGANILVDPNGEIKLADFGMAKHITSCSSVLSFKGSPYWMAPEVVMNMSGCNLAVDIWSLGCTILEMATSKPPWSHFEGVAAIFKIGNSKDIPEIPDFLSNDAKSFLKLCLQRDPSARPTASQLLEHPFVEDQAMLKIPNLIPTNETSAFSFDGIHKPQPLDIQPRRKSISTNDTDNVRRPGPTIWEARDNPRSITSLPVSPCSSPLRQLGATSKSVLSPPHPSYAWPVQSNYNLNRHSLSPTKRRPGWTLDPWIEATLFKAQTPSGSPQMRLRQEFQG